MYQGLNLTNIGIIHYHGSQYQTFPKNLKKRILFEIQNINPESKKIATSYNEYVRGMVGATLARMFYTTYPEKVWGIPTTQLTPEWAPKRINLRNKIRPFYDTQWNAVGKFGTGSIYENIKEKILKKGGKLYLNHKLTNINHSNFKINEIEFNNQRK